MVMSSSFGSKKSTHFLNFNFVINTFLKIETSSIGVIYIGIAGDMLAIKIS